ncbi:CoA-substrate-specific enzyme activase, putative [Lachnospiraceae bacterium JC7]|nr:CoA-substrate-specific enzyme activase, putative [Lachnospiraceae bacterium JC7]
MNYLGIDIGSTCAKTVVMDSDKHILEYFFLPTGWSSFDALDRIKGQLSESADLDNVFCVSTGYGREAVSFANKTITEITCHAKGAQYLFGDTPMNVIDIGGQDTKVISVSKGRVEEFFMNDKCSAGTGKFVEVMANRLGVPTNDLNRLAENHTEDLKISSMCTVFAESEIISLAGKGESRENIAYGILDSVANKVRTLYSRLSDDDRPVYLTGGLCEADYFLKLLSDIIGHEVKTLPLARYAGALGAAVLSVEKFG